MRKLRILFGFLNQVEAIDNFRTLGRDLTQVRKCLNSLVPLAFCNLLTTQASEGISKLIELAQNDGRSIFYPREEAESIPIELK